MARVGEPIVLATYDVSVRAASRAKHVFAYGSGDAVTLTVQGDGVHVFNVRPISIFGASTNYMADWICVWDSLRLLIQSRRTRSARLVASLVLRSRVRRAASPRPSRPSPHSTRKRIKTNCAHGRLRRTTKAKGLHKQVNLTMYVPMLDL